MRPYHIFLSVQQHVCVLALNFISNSIVIVKINNNDQLCQRLDSGCASGSWLSGQDHLKLYERLMEEMQFEPELAKEFCRSGAAAHILRLKDSGFVISESDPLIIISADLSDPASVSYFNNGNYGLPADTPGGLAWPGGVPPAAADPLPAGMAMKPPAALGRFLATLDGVRELSLGSNIVFYVKDMGVLHGLPPKLIREPQFRRIGPVMAALTGNEPEDDLVRVYTLDRMTGPAQLYPHFTSVP